jgi:HlyD family secretion protein
MQKINNLIKIPLLRFQKLSKIKKIIVVLIITAIIIYIQQSSANANRNGYVLEKAKISNVVEVVSETGNIIATGKTDIYSPATGIVDEVLVNNGDIVKKDQELFKVKSTATAQEQQSAYSTYLTAKSALDAAMSTAYSLRSDMYTAWKTFRDMATNSNYENADKTPRKDERLAAEFQEAQDDWLSGEKKYKDQQTVISQTQASVNSTWLLYQATQNATVLAQSDGTISNLSVDVGDNVKAYTGPLSTVKPVLSIADFSKYTVKLLLNETDIYKIKPGQEVTLQIDAFKNKKYQGTVERVDEIGTDENGITKYNVYIEIKNPDDKLRFGMTIDADIITNKLDNILTVPNSSVKPYKNGKAVRIFNLQTKQIDYIPVEIGIKGSKDTQVVKGISEGQEVITSLKNDQIKRKGMFGF